MTNLQDFREKILQIHFLSLPLQPKRHTVIKIIIEI